MQVRAVLMCVALGTLTTAYAVDKPKPPPAAMSSSGKQVVAKHAMSVIREAAREPESVKFRKLLINDAGTVVCAEFRGKNGFGGVSMQHLVLTETGSDATAAGWNKHCTKGMFNMDFLIN